MQALLQRILQLSLMVLSLNGLAQQVIVGKLQDNILLNPQKQEYLYDKIYLWGMNAEYTWAKVDSAQIDAKGNFVLRNPKQFIKALYRMAFTEDGLKLGVYRDIILTQTPDTLYWTFTATEVNSNTYFQHNTENRILSEALRLINAYKNLQKKYRRQVAAENFNYLDAQYLAKFQAIEKAKVQSFDSLQRNIKQFRNTYRGTYVADVLLSLFAEPIIAEQYPQKYDTRSAFLKDYFVQEWNLADASLLSVPFLEQRIYEYLSDYTYIHSYEGIRFSVDKLLKQAKANATVFDFMLNYLIKTYLHSGYEQMVNYIYEQYYDACSQPITSASEELKRFERMKKLNPGNLAPLIPLEKQGMKPFKELVKNYEVTIIYFWASTCQYCKKATPELKKSLAQFRQKIGVITVSLDTNEKDWKSYLKTLGVDNAWHHFCDLQGWQSEVIQNYVIRRTPTCYLVDSEGKIIGKEIYPTQVEEFLKKHLTSK